MAAISARPISLNCSATRGAVIGNTNLVSEQGHNWDLGLVFRGPADGVGLGLAEVVYYLNRVEDLIRFIQNSQRVSRPHNMGRALLRGVETRVEARPLPRLALHGNYAYQRAKTALSSLLNGAMTCPMRRAIGSIRAYPST